MTFIFEARPDAWGLVEPLLRRWAASRHCTMTLHEILGGLEDGSLALHGVVRDHAVIAVFATRIRLSELGHCLEVPLMVGANFTSFAEELHEYCTDLARREGCKRILITGRKGWAKVAARASMPPGFRVVGVVIAKEL